MIRAMMTQAISFQDVSRLCQRLQGDMDQSDMFPELPEQTAAVRRVAKTFAAAFGKVSQVLNRVS